MGLNSTGVAEGLSCNACDRKVTGSSLKIDFVSIIGKLVEWQGMALSFPCNFVKLVN